MAVKAAAQSGPASAKATALTPKLARRLAAVERPKADVTAAV
jgi:hypothetical protein